ncbi:MalM family protein [Paucibacter sp. O1-1]|nr:MalM family protein [Paucibacter sp. O1-1]MDA3829233.1 MalM family protein [Paucibacter sp. O1-1]
MRPAIPAAGLLAVAALAGCGTPVPTGADIVTSGRQALDAAPLCCASLREAARQPLPLKPLDKPLQIDNRAQVFDFGGNKAYFLLFELPAYSKPYAIELSSLAQGTLQDSALFIPRVALFDAEFRPTRFFSEKSLRNRGNNLERTVFINPADATERYIALYGSDLGASIERAYSALETQVITTGTMVFNFTTGRDGKSVLRSAPTGQLTLQVRGLEEAAK